MFLASPNVKFSSVVRVDMLQESDFGTGTESRNVVALDIRLSALVGVDGSTASATDCIVSDRLCMTHHWMPFSCSLCLHQQAQDGTTTNGQKALRSRGRSPRVVAFRV